MQQASFLPGLCRIPTLCPKVPNMVTHRRLTAFGEPTISPTAEMLLAQLDQLTPDVPF